MIDRRTFCRTLAGAAAFQAAGAQSASRPNILLILTDDQGWWDLGCHGNKAIETPVMDRLAGEGVEFTRFYVSPVCAPTRASIMTGRHYLRTGIYNTRFGGDTMRPEENTIAEVLRAAGYRTGMAGKWHLGRYRRSDPISQGFETALWFAEGHLERFYYPDQLLFDRRPIEARGYITRLLTDRAISFLDVPDRRPFFFYLPYNAPHEPHIVDNPYVEKYLKKGLPLREAQIYGMVTYLDEQIGRLLAHLEKRNLAKDTVVLFFSDNGGVSKYFKAGLRGNKGTAYEGGVRSPLFVRWPGKFPAGVKTAAMTAHIDLLPTLCELAGARVPSQPPVDGKSFLPVLRKGSGENTHEYLYHIWDRHRPSMKSAWAIAGARYKLAGAELFDMDKDPGETTDISAQQPQLAAELRVKFEKWLAEVTAGRSFEPPPIEIGGEEDPVEIQASWALVDGTHTTIAPPGGVVTKGPEPLGKPLKGSTINYTFSGYDWDTIDSWSKPGEKARWRLDVKQAGRYEVTFAYGCEPATAGGRFRVTIGGARLEGTVEPTAGRNIFWKHRIGEMTLQPGPAFMEVEVIDSAGKELMALNRIWLGRGVAARY